MVDRTGLDDLSLLESHPSTSEHGSFSTRAWPTASREPARSRGFGSAVMLEPLEDVMQIPLPNDSDTEEKQDIPYQNTSYTGHVVLETKSFISRVTDVDDHDLVRQIPLSRLAQGGEGSEETQFENAALIVLEGERNEKLSRHPSGPNRKWKLLAYKIHHNPVFYTVCLVDTLVLMGLAVPETPVARHENPNEDIIAFHILELFLLLILLIDFVLRFVWQGIRSFFSHRNIFMTLLLVTMVVELMVILIRHERHPRYLRALRPCFLVDAYLMYGVRRVLRQIIQCLGNILDVMFVLFYLIVVFATAGYLLFLNTDQTYFNSFGQSFVTLIITLTTANHPDVFMEAYQRNRYAPLFFISYLFVSYYYFFNVLLAVVFAKFRDVEKDKFKSIYIRRREALYAVFGILQKDNKLHFHNFARLMDKFKPFLPMHKVMCIYKSLQENCQAPCSSLTFEEFSHLYENLGLSWKMDYQAPFDVQRFQRYASFRWSVKAIKVLHSWVHHWTFNSFMSIIIMLNVIYLVAFIVLYFDVSCENKCTRCDFAKKSLPGSILFTGIYTLELTLRMVFTGWKKFIRKGRHKVDVVIIIISLVCILLEATSLSQLELAKEHLVIVRPLKLLRFIRLKERYFTFLRIIKVLVFRLFSVLILLFVVFYFFAILGLENFAGPDSQVFKGCCDSSWYNVGQYYAGSGAKSPNAYWLNNFNDIYNSFITLYEEMVVNNWYIQMEGFVSTTSDFARIYFIAFWLTTTIVVNIIIVYLIDAFETGVIAAKEKKSSLNKFLKKEVRVTFANEDVELLREEIKELDKLASERGINGQCFIFRPLHYIIGSVRHFTSVSAEDILGMPYRTFAGKRIMTNEDLRQEKYKEEIKDWVKSRERLREGFSLGIPDRVQKRKRRQVRFSVLAMKAKQTFRRFMVYIFE